MIDFSAARRHMIDGQLRPTRVTSAPLLDAMAALPRERFVPASVRGIAYVDEDLPIGGGRFLMEPLVLARLIQAAAPGPDDTVLDAELTLLLDREPLMRGGRRMADQAL